MTDADAPAEIPLDFRQGSPFDAVLQFFQDEEGTIPLDFTGYEINMQIREGVADSNAPILAKLSSVSNSEADARIFFVPMATDGTPDLLGGEDRTSGALHLKLPSAATSALKGSKAPKIRTYPVAIELFYDLEATPPGGEPYALAFGPFNGLAEVTR